ncbi:hypothetical protein I4U23_003803 [Adineta vaga]|nr:hypothetical protein I4U23_003803 [Adineta vaga]
MSNQMFELMEKINRATFWMNQIIPLSQIALGTFGNLFNIIIFTRPTLRTNSCGIYFLASSINNFFLIYVFILVRYISVSWNIDSLQSSTVLCKLWNIGQYLPFSLTLWFPVLSSIDRFLSTSQSVRFRQLSRSSISQRVIIGICIIFLLIHVHMLIYVESFWTGRMFVCAMSSYDYFIFFNFFGPIVACILPIVLMCIFGLLIVRNVRNIHNRIVPNIDNARNERLRSNDRQMAIMLLFQILITILISIPYVGTCMYYAFGSVMADYRPSLLEREIYNCANTLALLLYTTNPVIGFYIYTLTGSKFRLEMKRCWLVGLQSIFTKLDIV